MTDAVHDWVKVERRDGAIQACRLCGMERPKLAKRGIRPCSGPVRVGLRYETSGETADRARICITERLREIVSRVGAGSAEQESDPHQLLDRLEWGLQYLAEVEAIKAAGVVEEMSKLPVSWGQPRTTWGQVRAAILERVGVDPARYQALAARLHPEVLRPHGSSK